MLTAFIQVEGSGVFDLGEGFEIGLMTERQVWEALA